MNAWLAAWDALVALTVAFPLVTGGVWFMRAGHVAFEISQLGPWVLLAAATGFALSRGLGVKLERSASARVGAWLWQGWARALEKTPLRALAAGTAVAAALWATVSLRRHAAFQSNEFDLGIFTNALWNLVHGFGYVSAPKDGANLFADHASPLLWLLAPVFRFAARAETLLTVQAIGMALGGGAVYALARQYLPARHWGIAAAPLLYWTYLPLRNACVFDFHPEVFELPLFLTAIAGLQSGSKRRRWAGALALASALGGKESAGPVASGLGLAWYLGAGPQKTRAFTRRLAVPVASLGVVVFLFDVLAVPRLAGSAGYAYAGTYGRFSPAVTKRAVYLFWTLAPLGFLPLLGRGAWAALPGYLMLLLSGDEHRFSIQYHYAIEPAVGLFWALPAGIAAAEKRWGKRGRVWLWVLFWGVGALGRSDVARIRWFAPTPHARWAATSVLPCLDPSAPMAATSAWGPHLATRHWVHNVTYVEMPGGREVSCIVEDRSLGVWPLDGAKLDALERQWRARGYREMFSSDGLTVFESKNAPAPCLRCEPSAL